MCCMQNPLQIPYNNSYKKLYNARRAEEQTVSWRWRGAIGTTLIWESASEHSLDGGGLSEGPWEAVFGCVLGISFGGGIFLGFLGFLGF